MSILKSICWPTLTLMSVAKPWMLSSPAPSMSHSLGGLPGLLFSQAILLPPGRTGPWRRSAGSVVTNVSSAATTPVTMTSTANRSRVDRTGIKEGVRLDMM